MCIGVTDSLCYTPDTNATLQSNYTPKIFLKKYINIEIKESLRKVKNNRIQKQKY